MDPISEQRLSLIAPELAARARRLADRLALDGIFIHIVQGFRTVQEQDNLYAEGRTVPGVIVTNCKGGHSYHNYGMAFDAVPSEYGNDKPYTPDWNASHPAWKRMEEIGKDLGLEVGANWRSFPDAPHFQLTGPYPVGAPNDELRTLAMTKGLQAVWQQAGLVSLSTDTSDTPNVSV